MSDGQALPQIQDESTELTFVDSDYLLNGKCQARVIILGVTPPAVVLTLHRLVSSLRS
jgi:hypothetical protein